jgi:hypothetical protein
VLVCIQLLARKRALSPSLPLCLSASLPLSLPGNKGRLVCVEYTVK